MLYSSLGEMIGGMQEVPSLDNTKHFHKTRETSVYQYTTCTFIVSYLLTFKQ
jgi:hypothetical protein